MNSEREAIKQQLDDELNEIQFTGHERVILQTHPLAFGARLFSLWNKEIEIPVKPLGAIAVLFLVATLALHQPGMGNTPQQSMQPSEQRELIEAGGNMYWKDIYEQAVKQHEN